MNPSLQGLCAEVGLFGWQLILCCLKPPEEGAREAAELVQLLLAGLDGCKPARDEPSEVGRAAGGDGGLHEGGTMTRKERRKRS